MTWMGPPNCDWDRLPPATAAKLFTPPLSVGPNGKRMAPVNKRPLGCVSQGTVSPTFPSFPAEHPECAGWRTVVTVKGLGIPPAVSITTLPRTGW